MSQKLPTKEVRSAKLLRVDLPRGSLKSYTLARLWKNKLQVNAITVQMSHYLKLRNQMCRRLAGHNFLLPRDSSASDPTQTSLRPQRPKIRNKLSIFLYSDASGALRTLNYNLFRPRKDSNEHVPESLD